MATELAQTAYEEHFEGAPPVPWDRLPEARRERWRASVNGVLRRHAGAPSDPPREPGTADGDERFG